MHRPENSTLLYLRANLSKGLIIFCYYVFSFACCNVGLIFQTWLLCNDKLKTARAFSASVVAPDGTFWLFGGSGRKEMLLTTEKMSFRDKDQWKVRQGPNLPQALSGSCAGTQTIDT